LVDGEINTFTPGILMTGKIQIPGKGLESPPL
jgi:hypothetical protein